MNAYVTEDERDFALSKALNSLPENKLCFDCGSKNPKWASANIGLFLCYSCTTKHREMGVHISFARSLTLDKWKRKELKAMELGGNKAARAYYEKNGMISDGRPNHQHKALARYKMELAKRVEAALKDELGEEALGNGHPAPAASSSQTFQQEEIKTEFFPEPKMNAAPAPQPA